MNLLRMACVGMIVLTASSAACADGKIFSVADAIREPNQKALIWHEDGRETLILQVKYEGGGDFGWVVPVPGRPKLDTAPPHLFAELAWITRPEVVMDAKHQGFRGGGVVGGAQGVTVLEIGRVGPYDTTVLAATDPNALTQWLDGHGFSMPPGASDVLRSYTKRGWYYVALRIDLARRRDDFLRDLRTVRPEVTSLDTAADTLSTYFRQAARRDPAHTRNELAAVLEIILRYGPGQPDSGWFLEMPADWRRIYKRHLLYRYDGLVARDDYVGAGLILPYEVERTSKSLESALASGTITPIRLDFPSKEPVYPLYLTSLNGAPTDLQLYLLGEHRMIQKGFPQFRTTFARRFTEAALTPFPAVAGVTTPARRYLTELRATLSPAEMNSDLTFRAAATDAEFQEKVFPDGTPAAQIPLSGIAIPAELVPTIFASLAVLVAGAFTLRRLRRRRLSRPHP